MLTLYVFYPLPLCEKIQQTTDKLVILSLIFFQKIGLTFHANYLLMRPFGKIRKKFKILSAAIFPVY